MNLHDIQLFTHLFCSVTKTTKEIQEFFPRFLVVSQIILWNLWSLSSYLLRKRKVSEKIFLKLLENVLDGAEGKCVNELLVALNSSFSVSTSGWNLALTVLQDISIIRKVGSKTFSLLTDLLKKFQAVNRFHKQLHRRPLTRF